jgi:dUTP pyrophosphatase
MKIQCQVRKLSADAKLPEYATDGSGCFDIYAYLGVNQKAVIRNIDSLAVHTGLAFEIPEGHVMLVYSRSGMGFKHGVRLANCVAVIDSDYRGELMIKLTNDSGDSHFIFEHGQAIAQGMIIPIQQVEFLEVNELSATERGTGGFGSTDREVNHPDNIQARIIE